MSETGGKDTVQAFALRLARVFRSLAELMHEASDERDAEFLSAVFAAGWDQFEPISVYTSAADVLESLAKVEPARPLPLEVLLGLSVAVPLLRRIDDGKVFQNLLTIRRVQVAADDAESTTDVAKFLRFATLIGLVMIDDARRKQLS